MSQTVDIPFNKTGATVDTLIAGTDALDTLFTFIERKLEASKGDGDILAALDDEHLIDIGFEAVQILKYWQKTRPARKAGN